jgi:LCP family protein required for cell wall assembly
VVSLLPQSQHTTLVSVPRDLWVQYPPSSGQYTKINAVYEFGSDNGKNRVAGGDAAAQKISLVTGLNVKYWMSINFTGFRELIDSIGGIDVYVPTSFSSLYPKNDNPQIDASWITIHFKKGNQHMDGETAIRYARAREVLDNAAEGTDFARSARQQIIIKAVLAKVKQISTWPKLFNAMTALQHTIYTNLSFADLAEFTLKMNLNDPHTAHVGLSNQNVLADSQTNDGQYILTAANGNWQAIQDYVKQHLYN